MGRLVGVLADLLTLARLCVELRGAVRRSPDRRETDVGPGQVERTAPAGTALADVVEPERPAPPGSPGSRG